MDENNNLNGTDENQSQDGYTGEYGNSVEGDGGSLDSSIYSYSYKDGENDAQSTHSGDYYAGSQSESSASQNSRSYESVQKTNPYSDNANTGYNSTNPYDNSTNAGYNGTNPYDNSTNTGYNSTNSYTGASFSAGQEKKPDDKKKGSFGKKLLVCAACAVLFGVIAAVCFEGVCYISSNVLGINTSSVTTTSQIGTTTTSSNSKVATGAAVSGTTDVSSIVEQTMPAVVAITCTSESTNYYSLFGNSQQQETQSSGTGFIIGQSKSELLIATNNHVIDGAKTISVQFIDDQVYEASVKGKDSSNDLAVVAVKLSKIKKSTMNKIKIADVGDSDSLKVGEMAIAIGNSLGYGQSVTVGYISAKNREITETSETDGSTNSIKAIQTDAAINPGNSGGPLINLKGEVVGINSAKIADSSVEGVGYAIPISQATPIIDELKDKEVLSDSEKGYLGISGRTVGSEASSYNIPSGVYVAEVSEGGAADKGGVKVGDIITAINNQDVRSIESLKEKANSYRKGTEVELTLQRSDDGTYKEKKVKVKLQGSKSLDGLSQGSDSSGNSNNDSSSGNSGSEQGNGNDSGSNGYSQGNGNDNDNSDDGDNSGFGSFFSNPFGN